MTTSQITIATLRAVSGFGQVALYWDVNDPYSASDPLSLDVVELWGALANDRNGASKKLEVAAGHSATIVNPTQAVWYYWARARDLNGDFGDWYPQSSSAGIVATIDPPVDSNLINGKIVSVASGGALTTSVKTLNGNDPSLEDPVWLPFVNVNGSRETIIFTGPKSITIPSGSVMEVPDSTAFRLWVFFIKNGSDADIGVTNLSYFSGGVFFSHQTINDSFAISDTQAIGSPSFAQALYTTAIRTAAPMRLVAHLTWESGIVSGVWTDPVVELFGKSSPLPGSELQGVDFRNSTKLTNVFGGGGTTSLPVDDTIPQSGEGFTLSNFTIVPYSGANFFEIEIIANAAPPAASQYLALFLANFGAQAIAADVKYSEGTNIVVPLRLVHRWLTGNKTSQPYDIKLAYSGTGTVTVNGSNSFRILGGTMWIGFHVRERMG